MNATYTDINGVGYDVRRNDDGTWAVWSYHNKQTGWVWLASLKSYDLAMSFMAWVSNFKDQSL